MEIPNRDFSLEGFLDFLVDNSKKWKKYPKWLKVYLLYAHENWIEIFREVQLQKFGEIIEISFSDDSDIKFYAYEWKPGLLIMFTDSKEDEFEKTLYYFLRKKREYLLLGSDLLY